MGRVVIFGATGYTGRLATKSCVERGIRPVLAGRNRSALEELGATYGGLDVIIADADKPETIRAMVQRGDVLITTVGPYQRYGEAAISAAVEAGAHYLDLTGEPPFLRRIFAEFGPRAEATGTTLLPAFGHDWVPGNLAAAIALRNAGPDARRVEIGYFDYIHGKWFTGVPMSLFTSGTLATLASDSPPDSYVFHGGALHHERLGRHVHPFEVDGRQMLAMSYGATEQIVLNRLAPDLEDVEVYLGWLGQASRLMSATIGFMSVASRFPPVRALLARRFQKALQTTGKGPEAWPADGVCRTVAIARDGAGRELSRVDVQGPVNAYELSGQLLAWGAEQLLAGHAVRTGACGPVDAFRLDVVEEAFAGFGLRQIKSHTERTLRAV